MPDAIEETRRAVEAAIAAYRWAQQDFTSAIERGDAVVSHHLTAVEEAKESIMAAVGAHALAVLEAAEAFCRDGRGDLLDALRDRLAGKQAS